MKRVFSILLLLALCLSILLSCDDRNTESEDTTSNDSRNSEAPTDDSSEENFREEECIDNASPQEIQAVKENKILKAWTGDFSEEKRKDAIEEYQKNYFAVTSQPSSQVKYISFETDFEAVSCGVSLLSPTDNSDIRVELNDHIDYAPETKCDGNKIIISTGWWYMEDSWVNNYPVWSYLAYVKDGEGVFHYYYFRIDYSEYTTSSTEGTSGN